MSISNVARQLSRLRAGEANEDMGSKETAQISFHLPGTGTG